MTQKVRMSRGKFNGIQKIANEHGVIAAAAMDQRGSLKKAIAKAKGSDAPMLNSASSRSLARGC